MSDEATIENAIQAKGLTAPRLTPALIDAAIAGEQYHVFPGTTLTVCALTLHNGFIVTGESAAASPENFDEEIGRTIARANAREKIWSLLGFELRSKLALAQAAARPSHPSLDTFVGTKVIHARPMGRGDYNVLRGWTLPEGESPDDEGYLVEYPDSDGYVSWSPKDVFERSYQHMGRKA